MYDEIKPFIKGHVLEIGSGVGTYSAYLCKNDKQAVFSEIDPGYVQVLKKRFPKNDVFLFDMSSPEQVSAVGKNHKFDTIIFLNVLEHVKEDQKALKLLRTLLKPKGRIICLVPTHKFLYNSIDKSIGHYRRYTKKEIVAKVEHQGYSIEKVFSFNIFAIPGWFFVGNVLKKKVVTSSSMSLFNAFVPLFKFIEHYILFRSIGISTIIVARLSDKSRK